MIDKLIRAFEALALCALLPAAASHVDSTIVKYVMVATGVVYAGIVALRTLAILDR